MPKVMKSIGAIAKDRKCQNFKFRGVDDVLNQLQPALVEHGVSISVKVKDHVMRREGGQGAKFTMTASLKLILTFFAPDGSSVTSSAFGEAIDYSGDKATSKAMSSAFKYVCFLGLVIPLEGVLEESDEESSEQVNSITQDQADEIHRLLDETGTDKAKVLAFAGASKVEDIPANKLSQIMRKLQAGQKGGAK